MTHTHASRSSSNDDIKEKAVAAKDALADLASAGGRYASHRMSDVKGTATHLMRSARIRASYVNENVVGYIQRNPYRCLAIAAGAGLIAGYFIKRRR